MTVQRRAGQAFVGTIVGESTSQEFRIAVAEEAVREQDIIAVDVELGNLVDDGVRDTLRVWATVQRIERLNPLFPSEAGHELAATGTNPLDTVLSLTREMVSAVCRVVGVEPLSGGDNGKLGTLRYPPRPVSTAYRPRGKDLERILVGNLREQAHRALDIGQLANRPEINLQVDGHSIVTRHLAILAMTGAGKSWAARRIIEELAQKNYPIVIFDPHGDYSGLAETPGLRSKVRRYYAQFPLFEEDSETVAGIIEALAYPLSETMKTRFGDLFNAANAFVVDDPKEMATRTKWLAEVVSQPTIETYGLKKDMWLIANLAAAGEICLNGEGNPFWKQQLVNWAWPGLARYSGTDIRTLEAIKKRAFRAAGVLNRMERTSRKIARDADPMPTDRRELVRYGGVSVVSLAGYTRDFQATIYSVVADSIMATRVDETLDLPVLFVVEEAHNFVPSSASTPAEQRSVLSTRQIAQEGRKFGVGMVLISQRPSRLDETALSQCNSYIVLRMVNPADQRFVRRVVESLGEDQAQLLPDLEVGEAVLSGQFVNFPVLAKIKPPASKGEREEEDAFKALDKAHRQMSARLTSAR